MRELGVFCPKQTPYDQNTSNMLADLKSLYVSSGDFWQVKSKFVKILDLHFYKCKSLLYPHSRSFYPPIQRKGGFHAV